MFCEKCGADIPEEEIFNHGGKNYCEDCYIEIISVPQACDPMAVRSARLTRERLGHQGTEGLLPIQKKVYNYLREHGKATREQVAAELGLEPKELEKHFSVLRHCELAKGLKEGNRIYLTVMDAASK
ncbi:MAG: hypothetical protein GX996_01495 [Firmicutes bacterium]|nr:hypothetical protein [Bacillota bacterium]